MSRLAYTAYELGKREPDHNTLIAISNILDVSIDFLPIGRKMITKLNHFSRWRNYRRRSSQIIRINP
nr:helix-turn-helix transcriptional regulator [Bacillus altitudinis]